MSRKTVEGRRVYLFSEQEFGGRTYKLDNYKHTRAGALKRVNQLRKQGYSVRVRQTTASTIFDLPHVWAIYKRKRR